jgi:putative ABC transport system permease protein
MLITVKERTREIGIRKSIGATNGNILTQFMIEAIVISWVGSMIGVVIAYIIGLYLASTTDITPVYTISTIAAVIFVASLIGALAGLVPAFTAARKDPVQALRDE